MSLVKKLTDSIFSRIQKHYKNKFRREREKKEKQLPNVSLSRRHVEKCEVLPDRSALLCELANHGVVAEIGVAKGDFSSKILSKTDPDTLHLIDVWDSERYHQGLHDTVQSRFDTEIEEGTVEVHKSRSTEAADLFPANYFDWIYIDTNHSYETTRNELHQFAPKIKNGGLISGHDYRMGNYETSVRYGVIEAVHEFCVNNEWRLEFLTAETPFDSASFAIEKMNTKN